MTISLTTPVTGAPQTGLTSPTYTMAVDVAPDLNGKQYYASATGGTQVGVTVHTASSPFTVTFWRPKVLKLLGKLGLNGRYVNIPKNDWKVITRKGVIPAVGHPAEIMLIETRIAVPAGAETYDSANIRAALSLHLGAVTQQSAGIGDSAVSGTF